MQSAELIYANRESCADLLYATGFVAPDAFIYFKVGEHKGMIMSALEQNRAEKQAFSDIKIYPYKYFCTKENPSVAELVLGLAAQEKIAEFVVPYDFPAGLAEELRREQLQITPKAGKFFPEREYKNELEIGKITEALRVTEKGMERACEIIANSKVNAERQLLWNNTVLTSELLRAEINTTLLRHGALPSNTIVACGTAGADPHNIGNGTLESNQPIIIDIFPKMLGSGYWGDLTRTLVKGKASNTVKAAYCAVKEARDYAKTLIKVGAIPSDIHHAAQAVLDEHGFTTGCKNGQNYGFFHGLGHGVGLEIHETPRLNAANSRPLKGGEVVTVEPGVYYQDWGGIRLEDMVVVQENSCICLTKINNILELE